jgi:hypothetical protein
MGGEIGQQPELCAAQAHRRRTGRAGRRRHALAQLLCLLGEGAEVRAALEYPFSFGEDPASGAGLAQCEMGACELDADLDCDPGEAVVEHGPQAVGARQCRAGI